MHITHIQNCLMKSMVTTKNPGRRYFRRSIPIRKRIYARLCRCLEVFGVAFSQSPRSWQARRNKSDVKAAWKVSSFSLDVTSKLMFMCQSHTNFFAPGDNYIIMFFEIVDAVLQQGQRGPTYSISNICLVAIIFATLWLVWRLWKFYIGPILWPDEPFVLPYAIPIVGKTPVCIKYAVSSG